MKQVTLQIPDKKYRFFMELIKSLNFKTAVIEDDEPTKEDILQGLKEAVDELNLIKAGKKEGVPLKDFLNGL